MCYFNCIMKTILMILAFSVITMTFDQSKDEKTKNAIRKVMDDKAIAWNKGDLEGFMQGYWNSPSMTFVSSGRITKGWQPTLDNYKKSYDSKEKIGVLTFSDLEITVLSKESAVVLGKWALQREKDNPHGLFTLTFRKFKDGWKIILDHTE